MTAPASGASRVGELAELVELVGDRGVRAVDDDALLLVRAGVGVRLPASEPTGTQLAVTAKNASVMPAVRELACMPARLPAGTGSPPE